MKNFWKPLNRIIPELEIVRGLILLSIEEARLPGRDLEQAVLGMFSPPGKMVRSGMLLISARLLSEDAGARLSVPAGWSAEMFKGRIREQYKTLEDLREADFDQSPLEGALPLRFYLMAAAVELLHSATLLHDDVLDNADTRRDRPSTSSIVGNHRAILLGDQLLTMAFQLISDAASITSARLISRVVSGICRGELLQNAVLFDLDQGTSLRRYRERIAGKTAAMFSLSLYLGAREMEHFLSRTKEAAVEQAASARTVPEVSRGAGGDVGIPAGLSAQDATEISEDDPRGDSPVCRFIRRFGYSTGMAFQIIDDVLDLDIRASNGKEKGKDVREGIITLPLINMLRSGEMNGTELQSLWKGERDVDAFLAENRVREACAGAMEEAGVYIDRADRALIAAENDSGRSMDDLRVVSKMLLKRRY